ncbi:DUF4292 domain-containing protein [Riemerella columbina]|uniref:DUF4292 domain-containing protein n=1 Tax=Riemerella columbina TaxID=103810 RepID=UPI00266F8D7F|nr:DUF4292 domain-containing protein [Riemerella columbina]WKS95123.1 DUF4292 domain-containing protein [Riemerella columbina]
MKKIVLLFMGLLLFSCGSQKTVNHKPIDTQKPIGKEAGFFDNITKKSEFEAVKISSKIRIENGKFIPTLDALVYIENEKKVWINLSALFFNVARGIATPAGIKGYEKYNKTYIDSDFSYLNQLLNVNFIDYTALQNLLVGKTFIPVRERDFTLTQNAQGYSLVSARPQKVVVDGKTKEYNVSLTYNSHFLLQKVKLSDLKTSDYLEVFYDNWESFDQTYLPKNVKIIIKTDKVDQIFIENTKFDFSTMSTPYAVPNNYQKKEIK